MSIDLEPASLRVVTIESVMAIRPIAYRSISVRFRASRRLGSVRSRALEPKSPPNSVRGSSDRARGLRPHWEKMMRFWAGCQTSEPQALQLRLSLFENLVNQDLANETVFTSAGDLKSRSSAALQDVGYAHAWASR